MSTSKTKNDLPAVLMGIGVSCILLAVIVFYYTFSAPINEEVKFVLLQSNPQKPQANSIQPVNENFGIVIPKLNANAPVVANVDPYNEKVYQNALTKGVAHAKGTKFPNEIGTTFLFAHSAEDFYRANTYNAVFYLLYKLKQGDDILIYYDKERHPYKVSKLIYVEPTDVSYLTQSTEKKQLILMTCWPPGTTLKRLIVIADPV